LRRRADPMISPAAQSVLDFWFNSDIETQWFGPPDAGFDSSVAQRFGALHERARNRGLATWESEPQGSLALVIVLDQFTRHMFRGTARAFASDSQALAVARRALEKGYDRPLSVTERRFLYMPFMHSEALADQERAVALFGALNDISGREAAESHHEAIARFGRFCSRNLALGRVSTEEERSYLAKGGWP